LANCKLGVLNAGDSATRSRRADTLALARAADPIPVSEAVMVSWARLVADCRARGCIEAMKLTDALIAATAIAHGSPIVTQDADFDRLRTLALTYR
jgi:predicted nucleic acid-binding protein